MKNQLFEFLVSNICKLKYKLGQKNECGTKNANLTKVKVYPVLVSLLHADNLDPPPGLEHPDDGRPDLHLGRPLLRAAQGGLLRLGAAGQVRPGEGRGALRVPGEDEARSRSWNAVHVFLVGLKVCLAMPYNLTFIFC